MKSPGARSILSGCLLQCAFAVLVLVTVVGLGGILLHHYLPTLFSCDNEVINQTPSPNGQLKAVVFTRDCGATTSDSMQVSLITGGESLGNDAGNIFIAEGDDKIAVHWSDDTHLTIQANASSKPNLKRERFHGVTINYR